jgi:hypothetical protein
MHHKMFNSICGLHPLGARGSLLSWQLKMSLDISRGSLGRRWQNDHQLQSITIDISQTVYTVKKVI